MKKIALLVLITIELLSCTQTPRHKDDLQERKDKIKALETSEKTENQLKRRQNSITYCEKHAIPFLENLTCIESEQKTKIRNKDEIIKRALALSYLGLKSEGLEQKHLDDYAKEYQINLNFTKKEKDYVQSRNPTEQQKTDANWRYESLHVLLWALGYIDSLSYPSEMCNVANDMKIIFEKSLIEFSDSAVVRSKSEILDQADLIYRIHWTCVNSRIKNEEPPSQLNSSIVYERHYALNWLINYMNQDWDNISTDT